MLNLSAIDNGDGTCTGGVQGTANGFPNAGFGFFATYFTVWNQAEPSISFAAYSDVDDTAAQNDGILPTATNNAGLPGNTAPPSGTAGSSGPSQTGSSSSSKGLAVATAVPVLGMGVSVGALMAGLLAL
jgi:hypothetical protein